MSIGKNLRLQRFLYPRTSCGLIVPIDHGLTMGPLTGLSSVREIGRWITHPAITGVIAHKGMAERLADQGFLEGKALMIHLNGMSTLASRPDDKVMLTSVETAQRLGADGVSIQVNFDGSNDSHNLQVLGRVVDEASAFSLPVLAMVYDKVKADDEKSTTRLEHLIRLSMELGCDAVKIGEPRALEHVLRNFTNDIKIFIAGGSVVEEASVLELTRKVVEAGGAGLCVGRNVFQRENVDSILSSLGKILSEFPPTVTELPVQRERYGIH